MSANSIVINFDELVQLFLWIQWFFAVSLGTIETIMPLDLSSLLDVSHLATFIGGAAIGSAGQYLAERFTDQRRAQESASRNKKQFAELNEIMGALFKEMVDDLKGDKSCVIREFVILHNERIMFNSDTPRFAYYETKHPNIRNQVALLTEAGYLQGVTVGSAPIFRMQEPFVSMLRGL